MTTTAVPVDSRQEYIRRLVDAAPPLSDQKRAELRELFRKPRPVANST